MSKLKVGDVVRLKSGGPSMTISIIEQACDKWYNRTKGSICCFWFDKDGNKHISYDYGSAHYWFTADMLEIVPKQEEK